MCANPQKENGFTQIANEILEALARTNLPCYERRIFDAILRNTYGYNRKTWKLKKWNDLEDKTGIGKTHIQQTLESLKDKHFIKFDKENRELSPLKNYENWEGYKPNKKVTQSGNFTKKKLLSEVTLRKKKLLSEVTIVTQSGNFSPPNNDEKNDDNTINTNGLQNWHESCDLKENLKKEEEKEISLSTVNLVHLSNPKKNSTKSESERISNQNQNDSVLTKDPDLMTQSDWEEAGRLAELKMKEEEKEWYQIGKKLIETFYPMYFSNQQSGPMNTAKNELVSNIGMSYLAFPELTKECMEETAKNLKKPEYLMKWTYDKIMERKFNNGKNKR